jgi:hypothetical protein
MHAREEIIMKRINNAHLLHSLLLVPPAASLFPHFTHCMRANPTIPRASSCKDKASERILSMCTPNGPHLARASPPDSLLSMSTPNGPHLARAFSPSLSSVAQSSTKNLFATNFAFVLVSTLSHLSGVP